MASGRSMAPRAYAALPLTPGSRSASAADSGSIAERRDGEELQVAVGIEDLVLLLFEAVLDLVDLLLLGLLDSNELLDLRL